MHTRTCMHIYIQIHTYILSHTHIHIHIHTYIHANMLTCLYAFTQAHTYVYTFSYISMIDTFSSNYVLEATLKANEICERENDLCGSKLICIRCGNDSQSNSTCVSGNQLTTLSCLFTFCYQRSSTVTLKHKSKYINKKLCFRLIYIFVYVYVHSFRKGVNFILIYIICIQCFSSIHLKSSV